MDALAHVGASPPPGGDVTAIPAPGAHGGDGARIAAAMGIDPADVDAAVALSRHVSWALAGALGSAGAVLTLVSRRRSRRRS